MYLQQYEIMKHQELCNKLLEISICGYTKRCANDRVHANAIQCEVASTYRRFSAIVF